MDLTDEHQPLHSVGALLVPEGVWAGVKSDVEGVLAFAHERGLPAGQPGELHGKEILHGSKGWRHLSLGDRLEILSRCVEIIEIRDLKFVVGHCDKQLLAQRYTKPEHPHAIALWLCLERIAQFAKQRKELALLVADDCSPEHKKLSLNTLQTYRQNGALFGETVDFSWLIDIIHFMPSHNSPHIQLCDVVMYIQHRYRHSRDLRLKELDLRCKRRCVGVGVMPTE